MTTFTYSIIDNKIVKLTRFEYIRLELKKLQALRTKNTKQFGEFAADYHYNKNIKKLRAELKI
jgi:hypothetical protein